jgi:hypothetical protein
MGSPFDHGRTHTIPKHRGLMSPVIMSYLTGKSEGRDGPKPLGSQTDPADAVHQQLKSYRASTAHSSSFLAAC